MGWALEISSAAEGDGFERASRRSAGTGTTFALEPEQFLDAGDWVVVRGTARAKARVSGQTTEGRFAHLVQIRNGKTVRGEYHSDSAKEYKALNA